MSKFARLLSIGGTILLGSLVFTAGLAAQQTGQDSMNSMSDKGPQSLTGCLQRGNEPQGFTMTDESGKVWELQSTEVKLSDHVGHKVTVTGNHAMESTAHEGKIAQSEKSETAGKEHGDFRVSDLKMVSESCQ